MYLKKREHIALWDKVTGIWMLHWLLQLFECSDKLFIDTYKIEIYIEIKCADT